MYFKCKAEYQLNRVGQGHDLFALKLERILYHDLAYRGAQHYFGRYRLEAISIILSVWRNWLAAATNRRVMEVSKLSPFNYSQNAILYIPESCLSRIFMMRNILRPYPEIIHLICATLDIHWYCFHHTGWWNVFLWSKAGNPIIPALYHGNEGEWIWLKNSGEAEMAFFLPATALRRNWFTKIFLSSAIIVKLPFSCAKSDSGIWADKVWWFSQYVKKSSLRGWLLNWDSGLAVVFGETDTAVFDSGQQSWYTWKIPWWCVEGVAGHAGHWSNWRNKTFYCREKLENTFAFKVFYISKAKVRIKWIRWKRIGAIAGAVSRSDRHWKSGGTIETICWILWVHSFQAIQLGHSSSPEQTPWYGWDRKGCKRICCWYLLIQCRKPFVTKNSWIARFISIYGSDTHECGVCQRNGFISR